MQQVLRVEELKGSSCVLQKGREALFANDNIAGKTQNIPLKLICIKLIPFRDSDIERHIHVTTVDLVRMNFHKNVDEPLHTPSLPQAIGILILDRTNWKTETEQNFDKEPRIFPLTKNLKISLGDSPVCLQKYHSKSSHSFTLLSQSILQRGTLLLLCDLKQ
ncbi:hypothetical protein Nmel_001019 [Mimus melanotis]